MSVWRKLFPNFDTTDSWGQIVLVMGGIVQGTEGYLSGPSTDKMPAGPPTPNSDNEKKCPQTLPNIPEGLRTTAPEVQKLDFWINSLGSGASFAV